MAQESSSLSGILNEEDVETETRTLQDSAGNPVDIEAVFLPEPPSYDNVSTEGQASLQEIDIEELDDLWPVSWDIPGWTGLHVRADASQHWLQGTRRVVKANLKVHSRAGRFPPAGLPSKQRSR